MLFLRNITQTLLDVVEVLFRFARSWNKLASCNRDNIAGLKILRATSRRHNRPGIIRDFSPTVNQRPIKRPFFGLASIYLIMKIHFSSNRPIPRSGQLAPVNSSGNHSCRRLKLSRTLDRLLIERARDVLEI